MKTLVLATLFGISLCARELAPTVEIEETVYTYTDANNGAGPMWCSGSTCLVRSGDRVFASGLETIPDAKPLNNCRWVLFVREKDGWKRLYVDDVGRTREPSPMAVLSNGRVLMSVNPTLGTAAEPNGGAAKPDVLEFTRAEPKSLKPIWQGEPKFAEHSYRTFVADAANGEIILFQNIGYTHAEWTFGDRAGNWSAQGQLKWPWGAEYDKPEPIRVCYPNAALRDKAVYFVGVSDVLEPYAKWREAKRKITGQQWDYDFRRLFYTWTSDVTKKPFADWIEIASRDKTCGWISPGDLWVAPNGDVHIIWTERALDERLRKEFFPTEKQSHALNYAIVRDGKVVTRRTLMESKEDAPGVMASAPRFCITPNNRLFVSHLASGGGVFENRIFELKPDGTSSEPKRIAFKKPFTSYFTATPRAGSPPSDTLEMLGTQNGLPNTISYARVKLFSE